MYKIIQLYAKNDILNRISVFNDSNILYFYLLLSTWFSIYSEMLTFATNLCTFPLTYALLYPVFTVVCVTFASLDTHLISTFSLPLVSYIHILK